MQTTYPVLGTALLAGSALFGLLAIHPFVLYPATLKAIRRAKGARIAGSGAPMPRMALLVSAYDEEAVIVAKAENLLEAAATVPGTEVLVYVDCANDATAALLAPYADRLTVVVGTARRGKSHGLETLAALTSAEVLVFSDANVRIDPAALARLGERFRDPAVGCVSGHLLYGNGGESVTAGTGGLYWRVEEAIQALESDTLGMVGVDGSLFAVRAALKPHVPDDLIDDFYVSLDVALKGHAVVKAHDAYAWERSATAADEEFSRKIRIGCQAFNVHRALWPRVRRARAGLVYAYVSHRLLKWMMAYDLAAAAALFLGATTCFVPAGDVAGALLLAGAGGAAAWWTGFAPARKAVSMMAAIVGAGAGVAKSLSGARYQTWDPMRTTRTPIAGKRAGVTPMACGAATASLLAGSALFGLLAIHPFTTYPASLRLIRAFGGGRRPGSGAGTPTLALMVACADEAEVIVAKAENLLAAAATMPGTTVHVYLDAPVDATAALLAPFRDRIDVVEGPVRKGKSHGLAALVGRSDAEVLVFSDANVTLDAHAIERIAAAFDDPAVGCVSGHLVYRNAHESAMARSNGLYWRIEEAIQELEGETVGMAGVDGSLFGVRARLRPHVPDDVIDDFMVSIDVAIQGHAVVKARDAHAYERAGSDAGEEYARKVRIACRAFNVHRLVWRRILRGRPGLAYAYVSHRLLKWLVAYDLGLCGLFAIAASLTVLSWRVVAATLAALVAAAWIAWTLKLPGVRTAASVATAFLGVAVGVAKSLSGARYQTWTLQKTARAAEGGEPV